MAFPVSTTDNNLTGSFGPRKAIKLSNGLWSGGFHYGMDLAPEVRGALNPVYAVKRGTVTYVGTRRDAGREVRIFIPEWNVTVRYCHLSSFSVGVGQVVEEAQYIGRMGATGNVTGVHLHFEIYTDRALTNRVNPHSYIWNERNPLGFAINGGGKDVGTKPAEPEKGSNPAPVAPTPAPAPAPDTGVKIGSVLRLRSWAGYNTSTLGGRQGALLNGDFRVTGIHNGNFKVVGNGREAWVSGLAARGLVTSAAPVPVPVPAPAPKPAPAGGLRVGRMIRLATPWARYQQSNLTGKFSRNLPAGTYRVAGLANGNIRLQGNGFDGWVSGKASAGLI